MARPQKLVANAETGAEEYVDLDDAELADYNERQKVPPEEPPPPPVEQRVAEALVELPDDASLKDVKRALVSALKPKE